MKRNPAHFAGGGSKETRTSLLKVVAQGPRNDDWATYEEWLC